jgi:hypothetical protein
MLANILLIVQVQAHVLMMMDKSGRKVVHLYMSCVQGRSLAAFRKPWDRVDLIENGVPEL